MIPTKFEITDRWKFHPLAVVSASDFTLANPIPLAIRELVDDPRYSLYCLDFEKSLAYWAWLPPETSLAKGSFVYTTQFEHAKSIAVTSIEDATRIVASIDYSSIGLTIVHSVGRCGSTLINRVFESQSQVFSLSEPDTFTQVSHELGAGRLSEEDATSFLKLSIKAAMRPLPDSTNRNNVVLKLRSQCISIAEAICKAAPNTRNLYITRKPQDWFRSAYRAFVPPDQAEDPEFKKLCEDFFAEILPVVRAERSESGDPMSLAKLWMLNWIQNKLDYDKARSRAVSFLTLDYEDLKRDPRAAIESILAYAKVSDVDWGAVDLALSKDSQAGSPVAREAVKDNAISDYYFNVAMETLRCYFPELVP